MLCTKASPPSPDENEVMPAIYGWVSANVRISRERTSESEDNLPSSFSRRLPTRPQAPYRHQYWGRTLFSANGMVDSFGHLGLHPLRLTLRIVGFDHRLIRPSTSWDRNTWYPLCATVLLSF